MASASFLHLGIMPTDLEARFDPQRMIGETMQRAKAALAASDLDALFIFQVEDCRYVTGCRHHLGSAVSSGQAVVVLAKGG